MRLILAIFVGKFIFFLTRLLKKGGGSAAPGLYALKIEPKLIEYLVTSIPKNVTITGTNGKTTTSRLLNHFARDQKIKVLRNTTGSNLERGIASTLISRANFFGKVRNVDLGIWELDEAAFNTAALKLQPQVIVFLNAFRDQLDRYGEVDNVVKKWKSTLKKINSKTYLLLNGDDTNISGLMDSFKGHIETFGVQEYKIKGENPDSYESIKLNYEARNIKRSLRPNGLKQNALLGTTFQLTVNRTPLTVNLPIPGIYHIYDFLAAFSTGLQIGLKSEKMINSLKGFSPAFGRFEKIKVGTQDGYIFLIKNPAGATEVFKTISNNLKKSDQLLICLNDNFADGTDVSWIWDADFETLAVCHSGKVDSSTASRIRKKDSGVANAPQNDIQVICSGSRAYDLAVRLKYSGFEPGNIKVEGNLKNALESAKKGQKGRLFILPTYTALLELQKILAESGVKKLYWKES